MGQPTMAHSKYAACLLPSARAEIHFSKGRMRERQTLTRDMDKMQLPAVDPASRGVVICMAEVRQVGRPTSRDR